MTKAEKEKLRRERRRIARVMKNKQPTKSQTHKKKTCRALNYSRDMTDTDAAEAIRYALEHTAPVNVIGR